MSTPQTQTPPAPEEGTKTGIGSGRSPWQIMWAKLRRNRLAMFGMAVLGVLYTCAIFAGFLSPYGYTSVP